MPLPLGPLASMFAQLSQPVGPPPPTAPPPAAYAPYVAPVVLVSDARDSAPSCLDVRGGADDDGTSVIAYPCHGDVNQQWTLIDGQAISLGKCLDAEGGATTAGTRLIIWSCHGSDNQQWRIRGSSLELAGTGMCATSTGAEGGQVVLEPCGRRRDQRWTAG